MNGIALLMIVRQLGNLTGGPVEGGESVTHQLPSVVTHLHLVHPPTLAVGSAILAMLFVIAWRFSALSGSVDRDDPGCGCVAFVDLASNGTRPYGTLCSDAFGLHAYRLRPPTVDPSHERG